MLRRLGSCSDIASANYVISLVRLRDSYPRPGIWSRVVRESRGSTCTVDIVTYLGRMHTTILALVISIAMAACTVGANSLPGRTSAAPDDDQDCESCSDSSGAEHVGTLEPGPLGTLRQLCYAAARQKCSELGMPGDDACLAKYSQGCDDPGPTP